MELRWGVVFLALLQSVGALAHNNYHKTTDSNLKQKAFNSILHKLSKREIHCPEDEYPAETLCCKFCSAGTHAEFDCTEEHGSPKCKDCITDSNYMDKKNGYHACHTCSKCDSESGQEQLQACNVYQNTVCRCSGGFFCTENGTAGSDGCIQCQHCTQCEHGYAEECTATKDAVCKIQKPKTLHYGLIALVAIPFVVLLMIGILYSARDDANRDNNPQPEAQGNANRDNNPQPEAQGNANRDNNPQPEAQLFPENLRGIGLTDLNLLAFAEIMDYKTICMAVRNMGVSEPKVEEIRCNYSDHFEKKYHLLREWHQSQGNEATLQNLITTLQNNQKHRTAIELIQIVQKDQQQSQC